MNSEQEQLHFIGVGGVGMSGIARVAHDQGMAVSGSDIKESRYTKQLRDAGVTVFIGQDGANIPDGDVTVVVSTAILENNPELIEARRRNLPIVHRAQMLARLGRDLDTLAVAGTHGKTTTSSMLASTLDAMGYDPTFLIGGIVRAYGTNAHSGRGRSYVVEADESDKSFTYLSPAAAIVTNIEADHLDHYEGLEEIYAQFAAFLSGVREGGPIVVCGDDPKLVEVARGTGRTVTTYGFSEDCDARILATEAQGVGTRFTLRLPDGRVVASRIKQNPGLHNVSNGAAVLTLISLLGLDVDLAAEKLQEFAGVRRRFDLIGEAGGVTVVDDYAHHPTEIAATIKAAKARASLGEISSALEKHFGRHKAPIKLITGVYAQSYGQDPLVEEVRKMTDDFAERTGRRPRILVAKMGQDGHDRGAKVVSSAYADLGFDVDVGPLFQTPEETAKMAIENDVHMIGMSSLAAGHKVLLPALVEELAKQGRPDILVFCGGVIPAQDYDFLKEHGAVAIFGPGTNIPEASREIMEALNEQYAD